MSNPLGSTSAALIGALTVVVVLPFVAGAVCRVVAASYLGSTITWTQALGSAGRRCFALVGSWILVHLVQLLPYLPGAVVLIAGLATDAVVLIVVGALLLLAGVVGQLGLMALFVAVAPVVVAEQAGPLRALRRSARLLRPRFWPTLGIAVVSGIMVTFISSVIGGIPQTAGLFVGGDYGWVLAAVGGILSGLVTTPLIAIVATLVYFDGRIRREGLDLEILATELGQRSQP